MPSAHPAKTALALRRIGLVAVFITVVFLLRTTMPHRQAKPCEEVVTESELVYETGKFDDGVRILADIASDPAARERGLSGRECLGEDEGMLFLFPEPGIHCFWMKDMKFAIDMLWIGEDNVVVHIEQDVRPKTYPDSFCPEKPAKYVLELNAGKAVRSGFGIGTKLEL